MLSRVAVVILCVFAAVAGAAVPSLEKLADYSFEQFVQDFKLRYEPKELSYRRSLFQSELSRLVSHNAKGLGWSETVNRFSAMSSAEKKAFHGRSKGHAQAQHKERMLQHSRELPADFQLRPVSELPKSVDWRDAGIMSAVKDQGHCGSCWAFASTATIESHVAKATGLLFDLSTEQIAMCAPNPQKCGGTGACEGSTAELAFEYLSGSGGLQQEYSYPYISYYGQDYPCAIPGSAGTPVATINGYVELPQNNYTAIMNAVATVGPVAINVDASTWHSYDSGVFSGCNQASPDVNHVVVLAGYGEENGQKYWLVRNSWSPTWGEKGYIKLARLDNEEDFCGSDVTPQDGIECEDRTEPVKVCGTCGVIYDGSYPLNPSVL